MKSSTKMAAQEKSRRKPVIPAVNLVLNTLKTGGQALVFASTRKNSVSAAKTIAQHTGEVLSKPMKRTLEHEAEKILSAGERTQISETLAETCSMRHSFSPCRLSGGTPKD